MRYLLNTHSTPFESWTCFRKVSKTFQLLRDFLLEHGDLGAVPDYSPNSLISQAPHFFNLLPVADYRSVSRREHYWC